MVGIHWNKEMLSELDQIKSILGDSGRVLDVGAGNGETSELFNKNWEWEGIDIEPTNKIVTKGDAHKLEFKDDSFDLVISIATFEHIHSPWIAINEINRVMKKGALFFGTVAFLEREHGHSYFHMSQHGIRKILEVGKFEDVKVKPMAGWNVVTSMRILPYTGIYDRLKSMFIFNIRRNLIRLKVFFRSGQSRKRALEYLENDESRFTASFLFQGRKFLD
tara:strand:- start:23453 stop:24112 length:660 start_codon:yes stop_codon:yes gene_type:complete